jgi:hypothetical protein
MPPSNARTRRTDDMAGKIRIPAIIENMARV